jgi:hypothetical protein
VSGVLTLAALHNIMGCVSDSRPGAYRVGRLFAASKQDKGS